MRANTHTHQTIQCNKKIENDRTQKTQFGVAISSFGHTKIHFKIRLTIKFRCLWLLFENAQNQTEIQSIFPAFKE